MPSSLSALTRIARYDVLSVIDAGDTSAVFRARDPELERDVAVKVIASPPGDDAERRLDEARAMTKVSHPALVPIFDVGAIREGIFVVMPYLGGGTLHDWLRAEPRSWSSIVDRFTRIGRALATAHRAGVVHGDVSAEQVLFDREDVFLSSLALAAGDAEAGARADREAFARAFRDALDGRGPGWLTSILERSWSSIDAMLDRVEARRRLPARVAIGGLAVGVVAAAAVAVVFLRGAASSPCPAPTARLANTWSPQVRADLEKAMLATQLPYAADAVRRVIPAIEAYVSSWQSMYIATCRATHVARTQPAAMLDRRMSCLDRRLAGLDARMRALLESDRAAVLKSVATVEALPAIEDCADEKALERAQPMPADPARRAEAERTFAEIAELEAFGIRAEPAEFLRRAHEVVARTRIQGYLPAHVSALHVLATAQGRMRQTGELTLRELAAAAARAGDDVSVSLAWSSLVFSLVTQQRFDQAKQLLPAATTAGARAGEHKVVQFSLRRAQGVLACETGDQAACFSNLTQAVELAPNKVARADTLRNVIAAYASPGDYASARPYMEELMTLSEELAGTNHPRYADALYMQARFRFASGDPADLVRAHEELDRVIAIRVGAFGENHTDVAQALIAQANIAGSQGNVAEVERASRRALAIGDALRDPIVQVEALRLIGAAAAGQERYAEARPSFERALSILRDLYGPESVDFASMASTYSVTLQEAGDCAAAVTHARESLVVLDRVQDTQAAISLAVLAQCSMTTGAVDDGIAYYERAIAICSKRRCVTGHLESIQGYYAQWMIESGRDRRRGAEMLRATRDVYAQMGRTEDVTEVNAFLTKHHLPTK